MGVSHQVLIKQKYRYACISYNIRKMFNSETLHFRAVKAQKKVSTTKKHNYNYPSHNWVLFVPLVIFTHHRVAESNKFPVFIEIFRSQHKCGQAQQNRFDQNIMDSEFYTHTGGWKSWPRIYVTTYDCFVITVEHGKPVSSFAFLACDKW